MSSDGSIHSGHRRRMRERFLAGDLEGFSEHEVFEFLLMYSIPRIDVNEHAHRLIERFGSYRAVFDADYEDLLAVEGIGESSAVLIKLASSMWRKYALSENDAEYVYDDISKVGDYAVRLYVGVSVEKLYAMLFDNQMKLIDTVLLSQGTTNAVSLSLREVAEKAIKKNASSLILIHNHPSGTPYPSSEDTKLSVQLRDLLSMLNIRFIDHIIVSGRFYRPIFEEQTMECKFASSKKFTYGKATESGIREGFFFTEGSGE